MPYFNVKYPVFLTEAQYAELVESFPGGRSLGMSAMMVGATEAQQKLGRLIGEHLKKELQENEDLFVEKRVHFDFRGTDAVENVHEVFRSYCNLYGHVSVTRVQERTMDDSFRELFDGAEMRFPLGKSFAIDHAILLSRGFFGGLFFQKNQEKTVRLYVKVEHVNRVVGDLEKFLVYSEDFLLRCSGQGFEVLPNPCK